MSIRSLAIAAAVVALSATIAHADIVYTATGGPTCNAASRDGLGEWTCPGPAGYVVRFLDEGNVAAVAIGSNRRAISRMENTAQFRGAGRVFGDKIQWYLVDGKPRAAVIRTWRLDDAERETQQLDVYAIDRTGACIVESINVKTTSANERALARATEAARSGCSGR